jgi:type I restriction enzyme R subunit
MMSIFVRHSHSNSSYPNVDARTSCSTISSSFHRQQLALKIKNRNGSISEVEAVKVAAAILQEADKHCFPGWWNSSSVDPELSRSLLLLIAERFSTLGLLAGDAMEFIGQLVQVLRRAHYKPGRRDDT